MRLFLDVIKMNKRDVQALNNLAYLYVDDANDPNLAYPLALQAYKLQPDANVLDTYGWVLAQKSARESDPAKKADLLKQAYIALQKSTGMAEHGITNRYHLGWVYEQMGDKKKALELYQQVQADLKDKPKDPLYEPVNSGVERTSH